MTDELWRCAAQDLASRIAHGELSAREVVQAQLDRIDGVNESVRAVVVRLDGEALEAADRADARRASGELLGPLHGVPITLKENLDLGGHPTTQGVPALADAPAPADEPAVARLRAAGAIPIARTNMPDMGLRLHTDSALYGPTLNPWDPTRTPGGSSGGEAAALATGMSPLGVGNDMCGSLRWPSQCCGVATLKPTLGSIPRPHRPGTPLSVELIAVHGPMARWAADLRTAYLVMAGAHPCDPWSVPASTSESAGHLWRRRVAVTTDPMGLGSHPDVVAGIDRAAGLLDDAGWEVAEAEPPRCAEAARLWPEIVFGTPTEDTLGPLLSETAARVLGIWAITAGVSPDPTILAGALLRRSEILREWGAFFDSYGLWLTATGTDLP
ncbi:MAG: amidase family protein, partial [Acidimicrobiia bacterium]|nr:amidase family protein [Acidimicrobiia bacterium]